MAAHSPGTDSVSAHEAFVRRVAHEVSIGLVQVHAHDIVHLDIKPENILVGRSGQLKIGDFGSALFKTMHPDGCEGDAVYMAPELFSTADSQSPSAGNASDGGSGGSGGSGGGGGRVVATAADMFSLGLMLWELATSVELPLHGPLWHHLRNGGGRGTMIHPESRGRYVFLFSD